MHQEVVPTLAWLVAAAFLLSGVQPVVAGEIVVEPGTSFFVARGSSSIWAAPWLFCGSNQIGYPSESFPIWLSPDSLVELPGCWAESLRANCALQRLAVARLPAIGSNATIPVRLRELTFFDGYVLLNCLDGRRWYASVVTSRLRPSAGHMTIRREQEYAGTFDLEIDVYLRYTFVLYLFLGGPPSFERMFADLGPYKVTAAGVPWSLLVESGPRRLPVCPPCSGNLQVQAMRMSGWGNSLGAERDDAIRLENSELSLMLDPACAVMAGLRPDSWGGIKALYRPIAAR